MFIVDLTQLIYLIILLVIGSLVLYLRRKAGGSKSVYKLTLILLGIAIAVMTLNKRSIISLDASFLQNLSVLLLIILLFEYSVRLNPDNVSLKPRTLALFFSTLIANTAIVSIVAIFMLKISPLYGVLFAIIISSIEYFMVDELKEEGDLANPFLILFIFAILFFYGLTDDLASNVSTFVEYLAIGLGMGVIVGIIIFKSIKNKVITWFHEIGLIAIALTLYVITNQIGGSGLFAVMILGVFFGNSYVRKASGMKSFSPFIFKSLEILLFLLLGFVMFLNFGWDTVWRSLTIFVVYLIIRFIIITAVYKHYSLQNKLLLTFAPKGMGYAAIILTLGSFATIPNIMISTMVMILVMSLICTMGFEYYESKKIRRLDKIFYVLKHMRFGRKKDLLRRRISLFHIFRTRKKKE